MVHVEVATVARAVSPLSSRRSTSARAVREGGCPGACLDAANLAQVREEALAKGLITDAEIDAVLARLDAPDFAVFSPVMFTAWGRRPELAASQSDHDLSAAPQASKRRQPNGISRDHT
jgi:hypothetical protein